MKYKLKYSFEDKLMELILSEKQEFDPLEKISISLVTHGLGVANGIYKDKKKAIDFINEYMEFITAKQKGD